jgi:DNA-binding response OmpR family regulator
VSQSQSNFKPDTGMGKILIVDDSTDVSEPLARLLNFIGHDAVCVDGGEAAISFINNTLPDLVLLDIMMPGMDGIEVLRRIRANARTANLSVIMFSAVSDDAYRSHAMEHGANDYWLKGSIDYGRLGAHLEPYMPR